VRRLIPEAELLERPQGPREEVLRDTLDESTDDQRRRLAEPVAGERSDDFVRAARKSRCALECGWNNAIGLRFCTTAIRLIAASNSARFSGSVIRARRAPLHHGEGCSLGGSDARTDAGRTAGETRASSPKPSSVANACSNARSTNRLNDTSPRAPSTATANSGVNRTPYEPT
jgi:hypothetical protein